MRGRETWPRLPPTARTRDVACADERGGGRSAQGNVLIANHPSLATAIVTNKNRWLYAFTVANYFKRALPSEIHAALAAIFGAKLD
jgi:hypothetical protein